jgi:hypothetical protein
MAKFKLNLKILLILTWPIFILTLGVISSKITYKVALRASAGVSQPRINSNESKQGLNNQLVPPTFIDEKTILIKVYDYIQLEEKQLNPSESQSTNINKNEKQFFLAKQN